MNMPPFEKLDEQLLYLYNSKRKIDTNSALSKLVILKSRQLECLPLPVLFQPLFDVRKPKFSRTLNDNKC